MRKLLSFSLIAVVGQGAATGAMAMFAAMTVEDLFESAAIETVGDHREGMLTVEETLKGAPSATVRLWIPSKAGPISSSDIVTPVGTAGLWFLTEMPGDDGHYRIDHPQRFVPAAQAQGVIDQIGSY